VKFTMGSTVLSALAGRTAGSSDELHALIRQLITAAEPLEGRFDGAGKAAFDQFKRGTDEVTAALDSSLRDILGGQFGMDRAFRLGDEESADDARRTMAAANFAAARFNGR
jgi:uncharacterized protein YukE